VKYYPYFPEASTRTTAFGRPLFQRAPGRAGAAEPRDRASPRRPLPVPGALDAEASRPRGHDARGSPRGRLPDPSLPLGHKRHPRQNTVFVDAVNGRPPRVVGVGCTVFDPTLLLFIIPGLSGALGPGAGSPPTPARRASAAAAAYRPRYGPDAPRLRGRPAA
jgi:hypothetical protein